MNIGTITPLRAPPTHTGRADIFMSIIVLSALTVLTWGAPGNGPQPARSTLAQCIRRFASQLPAIAQFAG